MRTQLMRLHILHESVGQIIRTLFGVMAVLVASAAYSGYSVKIKGLGVVVKSMFLASNPVVDTINRMYCEDGARSLACTYLWEYVSPIESIFVMSHGSADSGISVGEINAVVGDSTYSLYEKVLEENDEVSGSIDVVEGDSYAEELTAADGQNEDSASSVDEVVAAMSGRLATETDVLAGFGVNHSARYLLKHFYIVDSTTSAKTAMFNTDKMLGTDFTLPKDDTGAPQILIYHTHAASEGFADSKSGDLEDGIIGVGNELARILTETYGYGVYHDKTPYDMINGKIDRSAAYAKALPGLKDILADNPSIKVIIDLHRDGIGSSDKALTIVNGEKTARVMFFNGLSRTSEHKIKYLNNENLFGNLSFSLQMKLKAMELYPDFTKPIYLKGYRYNLHLLPRSLLIELGNQNNTVAEAKNAAAPLADILDAVLSGRQTPAS